MNFSFITQKPLWQNILAGFVLSVFIVGAFLLLLNFITNHGEYLTVPEVKGKVYSTVVADLESKGFEVVVQDSIYVDSLAPNIIIKQFPDPEATVKVNRIIYLTINCTVPPTIAMPNLIGMSFRNAILELKSLGLKMGDTTFIPDMAKNAVKDQLSGGSSIKPGSPIRMGSSIDLLIGAGLGAFLSYGPLQRYKSEAVLNIEMDTADYKRFTELVSNQENLRQYAANIQQKDINAEMLEALIKDIKKPDWYKPVLKLSKTDNKDLPDVAIRLEQENNRKREQIIQYENEKLFGKELIASKTEFLAYTGLKISALAPEPQLAADKAKWLSEYGGSFTTIAPFLLGITVREVAPLIANLLVIGRSGLKHRLGGIPIGGPRGNVLDKDDGVRGLERHVDQTACPLRIWPQERH